MGNAANDPIPSRQELVDEVRKWKRVVHATNRAVEDLHAKLDEAAKRNAQLERQLSAANQNLDQQKKIVADHLAQSREETGALIDEIRELKKMLREAGVVDRR